MAMRYHNRIAITLKMGKEAGAAQQHPVKEQDAAEHDQKPGEKVQKPEIIPDAVPHAESRRAFFAAALSFAFADS